MVAIAGGELARIEQVLRDVLKRRDRTKSGKTSQSHVEPAIAAALSAAGYVVDPQDRNGLYPNGTPPWREENGLAAGTRRSIDTGRHAESAGPEADRDRRRVTRRDVEDGMVKIEVVLHPEESALVWALSAVSATARVFPRKARGGSRAMRASSP